MCFPFLVAAMFALWLSASATELVALWILSLAIWLAAVLATTWMAYKHKPSRREEAQVVAAFIGCSILMVSIAWMQWPLRISYALSRPAFDALAVQMKAGAKIKTPLQIGLFTIEKAEIRDNGIPCLWTDADPSGYTGFVQCPPVDVPFNLWSQVTLDKRWQFISED